MIPTTRPRRRRSSTARSGAAVAWLALCPAALAQPEADPVLPELEQPQALADPVTLTRSEVPVLQRIPDFAPRLGALKPDRPLDYFELGEELASEAVLRDDVRLAQQTLALAIALDHRARGGQLRSLAGARDASIAASACLALASLERLPDRRRWLMAVGRAFEATPSDASMPGASVDSASAEVSQQDAFRAASAMGLARAGEGSTARGLLALAQVRLAIERAQPLLVGVGEGGSVAWYDDQARLWPCPECRNARVIRRPGPQGIEIRLCPWCRGNPGPTLSAADLIGQLRVEASLLSGSGRTWASQLALDRGAVLLDASPEEVGPALAIRYGVSIERPLWRDGQWVAAEGAPSQRPAPSRPAPEAPNDP